MIRNSKRFHKVLVSSALLAGVTLGGAGVASAANRKHHDPEHLELDVVDLRHTHRNATLRCADRNTAVGDP